MRFVRAGVEFRPHARPEALHLLRIVRAVARAFVQRARARASVRKHVSSPGLVVMQANHAIANRTFRIERVKSLCPQQLYKFDKPYGQTHGCFPSRSKLPNLSAFVCPHYGAYAKKHRRGYEFPPHQPAEQAFVTAASFRGRVSVHYHLCLYLRPRWPADGDPAGGHAVYHGERQRESQPWSAIGPHRGIAGPATNGVQISAE